MSLLLAHSSRAQYSNVKETHLNTSVRDKTLIETFDLIELNTDFTFYYNKKDLDKKLMLNFPKGNGHSVADLLFEISKQAKLKFKQVNNNISVTKIDSNLAFSDEKALEVVFLADVEIAGKIIDENGEGLPGAAVVVKGTTTGTTTDIDGNYRLTVPEQSTLTISFVGYKTQDIIVGSQSIIDVQMKLDAEQLEEVVVIGYGSVEKRDLTGSVSSFDEKALDRQAANNITELMRSALPGLNVGISTNAAGSSGLEVRGPTSLGASNSPLLVVDDVIFQGDLSSINPADVASVNVLKDASAAAVYGSRAAAGVIIITTKKGKTGKPIINIRSSIGMAHAGVIEDVYSGEGFMDYKRDIFEREDVSSPSGYYHNPNNLPDGVTLDQWLDYDGLSGTQTPAEDVWLGRLQVSQVEIDNYKAGTSLDWKDIMFQTGLRTNNTISISGKSDDISYYASLGYVQNEGISLYQKYQSLRGRLNLEAKVNKFVSVGVNMQASDQAEPTGIPSAVSNYDKQSPFGSLYYDDGTFKHLTYDDNLASNPYLWEYKDNYYKEREVFSNIYSDIKLPLGFSYRINWSTRLYDTQDYRFTPVIASLGDGGDAGSRQENMNQRWMVDNILRWKGAIGEIHSFDFTFLYNVEEGQSWSSTQSNSNFDPNDKLGYHNLSIGQNPSISASDSRYTADALMGRLNYGLLDRYYLTLTLRRDGYSAFGQSNPRALFPAISFAWRISDEAFLSQNNLINNLKLRLSWGKNGNREIGIYSALARLRGVNYIYDQSTVVGVNTSDLANKDLKWESTASYNAGIDFGILDSRIYGSIDAYYMVTNDLLLQRSLPIITGYDDVFANLGEVQNRGLELALNTVNIDKGKFSWKSNFSFWMNRNKITHLYGDMVDVLDENSNVIGTKEEDDIQNNWYIGHAVDEIFDYKIAGIWQLGEEAEATEYGREPGDVKILDVDENGVIDFDDKVFQGNKNPQYRMSIRNDFNYGNFDFSILMNSFLGYKGANNEHFNYRVQQQRLNKVKTPYWTPDNPTNEWARLSSKNSSPATNWWESKSFLRVQNITIGYTFPESILEKVDIKKMRVYANVQNLPAISGWQYRYDVETSAPTPLIYTLGVDLSF